MEFGDIRLASLFLLKCNIDLFRCDFKLQSIVEFLYPIYLYLLFIVNIFLLPSLALSKFFHYLFGFCMFLVFQCVLMFSSLAIRTYQFCTIRSFIFLCNSFKIFLKCQNLDKRIQSENIQYSVYQIEKAFNYIHY